jgi:hypothetical protein
MRKIIGGVGVNTIDQSEWYFISVKNEDNTYENLLYEKFDRKKSYGVEFVIETANRILLEKSAASLTDEETSWLRNVDANTLQTEILSAAPNGDE